VNEIQDELQKKVREWQTAGKTPAWVGDGRLPERIAQLRRQTIALALRNALFTVLQVAFLLLVAGLTIWGCFQKVSQFETTILIIGGVLLAALGLWRLEGYKVGLGEPVKRLLEEGNIGSGESYPNE